MVWCLVEGWGGGGGDGGAGGKEVKRGALVGMGFIWGRGGRLVGNRLNGCEKGLLVGYGV